MKALFLLASVSVFALSPSFAVAREESRPNILFCIADDWGWPHAGAYGEPVIETRTFDRLAREGVLFEHAFVSSPSCTPSRSALLTGQWHWRLENAANLHSTLPARLAVYPELLAEAGYHVGSYRKAWGPGRIEPGGREARPAGPRFKSFGEFLAARPEGAPFCFWFGSSDPHRPYKLGSGEKRGMDLSAIRVPSCFPDVPEVRGDVADYFFEVERFDRQVGEAIAELEKRGELDDTLVVMTGDHGMPFPRCKGNLYDLGSRVPLAMRWGESIPGGRRIEDHVSLVDLAPTFLEAAGLPAVEEMSGRSLLSVLVGGESGRIDPRGEFVLIGRERHTPAQTAPSTVGYPSRAIRTFDFLYIRNFEPDRWPAGVPESSTRGIDYADCDNGPTKTFLLANRDDSRIEPYFTRAFARRPAEELYDLRHDPHQWINLAADPAYAKVMAELTERLTEELRASGDPRIVGGAERFESYPYYGGISKKKKK